MGFTYTSIKIHSQNANFPIKFMLFLPSYFNIRSTKSDYIASMTIINLF